jgi:prevent-host-death family protein
MTTTTITTLEAKEDFSELINRVSHNKERIILTRRDKEVAVVICMEDYALLQTVQNQVDLAEAVESLKEMRHHGGITLEKLKEEIE